MKELRETTEVKTRTEADAPKTKAFENAGKDVEKPKVIKTINEELEGKTYPGTDVKYKKHTFKLNGEKVEGVFPVFESKLDVRLPKELHDSSREAQAAYCTRVLQKKIESDPELAKQFTPRQLEEIKAGSPKISGLTWHHNEIPGKMQLVNSDLHQRCRHSGGYSIWGKAAGKAAQLYVTAKLTPVVGYPVASDIGGAVGKVVEKGVDFVGGKIERHFANKAPEGTAVVKDL